MSFLKKEDEEPQKFISMSDILTLLVIAGLGFGGYYYFKWAKSSSEKKVAEVLEYVKTVGPVEALEAFESLNDLQYKSDSLDSIIYENQSALYDRAENQKLLLETIEERLAIKDTEAVASLMTQWVGQEFLTESQLARVKEIEEILSKKSEEKTPADSVKK